MRGGDGEVMSAGVLDDEMAVHDRDEQEMGEESLRARAAVQKLVRAVDALRGDEGRGPNEAEEAQALGRVGWVRDT